MTTAFNGKDRRLFDLVFIEGAKSEKSGILLHATD